MHQNTVYFEDFTLAVPVSYLDGGNFVFTDDSLDLGSAADFNLIIL